MIGTGDAHIALHQSRGKAGVTDVFASGANLHRNGQVDTTKHDARVHGRRPQRHIDFFTRVKTDTRRTNYILERTLSDHLLICPLGRELTKRAES
jgi:transposase InsO family protein